MKARKNSTRVSLLRVLVLSRSGKRAYLPSFILYSSSWIINFFLDGLVCSIMGCFIRLLHFDSPYGLAKIQGDS